MPKKVLTIAAARLRQDKAWEAVERARADLRAAIREGIPCTNCGGKGFLRRITGVCIGDVYPDCLNCEGFGSLDPPNPDICIRYPNHDGPCNGLPRKDCPGNGL